MADVIETLSTWIGSQRWYGGKLGTPSLSRIGGWRLDTEAGAEVGATIETHLIRDGSGPDATLYQVPVVESAKPEPDAQPGFIGSVTAADGVVRYLYDGPQHPLFARALLDLISTSSDTHPADARPHGASARGHNDTGIPLPAVVESHVLRGEQSNTSIIYRLSDGQRVICKVFRALHHGENPDVVLQTAISASGSEYVPRSFGDVLAEWDDARQASGRAIGHVAFAQEFLPSDGDAWRVAVDAAGRDESFSLRAFELGLATAKVHETLSQVMPTRVAMAADITELRASMQRRLDLAAAEVATIATHRTTIETVYESAASAPWPPLQRIHGDYHLGQVISVPERGWVLLDFEGEPLRPMNERSEPDVTLRDVAGMLRSFDYAAGAVMHSSATNTSARQWAEDCRAAFLRGYAEGSGIDLAAHQALLEAFELDKAVYEAVYEARNRPDWLAIPVAAIEKLLANT